MEGIWLVGGPQQNLEEEYMSQLVPENIVK